MLPGRVKYMERLGEMKYLLILVVATSLSLSANAQEYQRRTLTENDAKIVSSRKADKNNSAILRDYPDTNNGYTNADLNQKFNAEFANEGEETYMDGAIPVTQDFNNVCLIPAIKDFEMSTQQNYCPQHVEGPRRRN
jgi:hypothetical protein